MSKPRRLVRSTKASEADESDSPAEPTGAAGARSPFLRIVKMSLVILGIIAATLIVAAYLSDEEEPLPFQYEGFD